MSKFRVKFYIWEAIFEKLVPIWSMTEISLNKVIPPELKIESIDDILYRIGLPLDSIRDRPKRKWFFKPIIVFTFLSIYLVKEVIIISLNEENDLIFKILGSHGYLLGMRKHLALVIILFSILVLSCQWIYYYNQRSGIKPTFLRVIQMMSGLVTPKSIGLTDEKQILKLLKISRITTKILYWNNNWVISSACLVMIMTIYSMKTSFMETLLYGIPNGFALFVWIVYVWNITDYQFFFLYVICLYLNL